MAFPFVRPGKDLPHPEILSAGRIIRIAIYIILAAVTFIVVAA